MNKSLLCFSLLALITGCGGGGGGSSNTPPPPPPVNASAGGIWEGITSDGAQVLGLVTETGEFHFLQDDGVQYFGTAVTSQNAVSANFTGVTEFGTAFLDGSTSGTGTLTGTVQERMSLSGTSNFRTAAGNSNVSTVTLTYNVIYERDSSLVTIAGNFTEVTTGDVVNINANGAAFMQDPVSGCVINGTVSIIDSRFNAYRVQYTYSSCQGQYAVLNGSTFRGLAALNNTAVPEELVVGATGAVGATGISAIFFFVRT